MFGKYSVLTKIIIATALILGIVLVIWFRSYSYDRSKDLAMVAYSKSFAVALEKYYDKFNAYPLSEKINLNSIMYLTENGINQQGDFLYFRRSFDWPRSGTYSSDGNNYAIDFGLEKSWDIWSIKGNGLCRIATGVNMACVELK